MARVLLLRANFLIEACWRIFISLRLTFVLLIVLAIGSFLGMSYDQTLTFDEFLAANNNNLGILINFLELNDAFHSWWYSLAIVLLSANLIACSIERLPRIYFEARNPRPYLTDRRLLGLNLKAHGSFTSLEQAKNIVLDFMGKKINLEQKRAGVHYFFSDRNILARFGVYIVHIALLIVMYSSVYTTQNGVDGHVLIEEGKKTRFINAKGKGGITYVHDLGFYVGCDDFRLRTFVDNSPMEYESDLFIDHGQKTPLISKTVRVNEPLSYEGYTFYQASFRPVISEKSVVLTLRCNDERNTHRVHLNSEIALLNDEFLIPDKLYDDFAGLGQALRLTKKNKDGTTTFFHIFRQYPEYDQLVRQDYFDVTLIDVDQQYATGLSVGYVPGISVIFSGFLLLLCGLFLCFFITPVRYFARIEEKNGEYSVIIAAQAFRHHQLVKNQFNERAKTLNLLPLS